MKIDFKNDFYASIFSREYEHYEVVLLKDNIVTAKALETETYDVSVEVYNGIFMDGVD